MRPAISARSEQTKSPLQIQIINRALRDAALAPSANDALDCCAKALLRLAEIARAEQQQLIDRDTLLNPFHAPSTEYSLQEVIHG